MNFYDVQEGYFPQKKWLLKEPKSLGGREEYFK